MKLLYSARARWNRAARAASEAWARVKKRQRNKGKDLKAREIRIEELEQILERARGVLSAQDHDKLQGAMQTLAFLRRELEAKGASIQKLRSLLFGSSTEKTSKVLEKAGVVGLGSKPPLT